jgi:hypothetical protein
MSSKRLSEEPNLKNSDLLSKSNVVDSRTKAVILKWKSDMGVVLSCELIDELSKRIAAEVRLMQESGVK